MKFLSDTYHLQNTFRMTKIGAEEVMVRTCGCGTVIFIPTSCKADDPFMCVCGQGWQWIGAGTTT